MKIFTMIFLSIIFICSNTYASIDREFRESRKCSGKFTYFEKKYKLPTNILHSISLHETGKKHSKHKILVVWPWAVMDNKEGKSYHFRSQIDAISYVRRQFMLGNNNLDVGCMQINLKHHPNAFSSLSQAFSPIKNIAYGAHFLNENLKKLGSIEKAIGRYHSATTHLAEKYQHNVRKISQSMNEYQYNLRKISAKQKDKTVKSYEMLYADGDLYRKSWNVRVKPQMERTRVNIGKLQATNISRKKNT